MTTATQGSLDLGAQYRDEGMRRAEDHANRSTEGWSTLAFVMLEAYAREQRFFTSEQFIAYAFSRALPQPPDKRAFGSIIRRAVNARLIEFKTVEASASPSRHKGHATLWRSRVYKAK